MLSHQCDSFTAFISDSAIPRGLHWIVVTLMQHTFQVGWHTPHLLATNLINTSHGQLGCGLPCLTEIIAGNKQGK
jgi:hypothetical protein